jgi:hypothetical protein
LKLSRLRRFTASDLDPALPFPCKIFQAGKCVPRERIEIMDFSHRRSATHASLHMNFQK